MNIALSKNKKIYLGIGCLALLCFIGAFIYFFSSSEDAKSKPKNNSANTKSDNSSDSDSKQSQNSSNSDDAQNPSTDDPSGNQKDDSKEDENAQKDDSKENTEQENDQNVPPPSSESKPEQENDTSEETTFNDKTDEETTPEEPAQGKPTDIEIENFKDQSADLCFHLTHLMRNIPKLSKFVENKIDQEDDMSHLFEYSSATDYISKGGIRIYTAYFRQNLENILEYQENVDVTNYLRFFFEQLTNTENIKNILEIDLIPQFANIDDNLLFSVLLKDSKKCYLPVFKESLLQKLNSTEIVMDAVWQFAIDRVPSYLIILPNDPTKPIESINIAKTIFFKEKSYGLKGILAQNLENEYFAFIKDENDTYTKLENEKVAETTDFIGLTKSQPRMMLYTINE